MLIGFKCKHGNVTFDYCLKECRDRCMSRRTANTFGAVRRLSGKSITQLLMPTRQLWLMMTTDYHEDPDSLVDRMIGILGHIKAEKGDIEEGLKEERGKLEGISGQFDFYDGLLLHLYDQKITGAWKVKQYLDTGSVDMSWTIQINYYRLLVQDLGFKVNEMFIEVWVKDSAGYARKMGVKDRRYLIPVKVISDHWIRRYIQIKKQRIEEALRTNYTPKCSFKETWKGSKCINYCAVLQQCKEINESTKPG